ncbi:hypothetical protein Q5H93_12315 [Hymenobacter sp. ASUV-10]|uniref:Uncharacterized protein n=1 Tax=Hymenobacter aranciens TaxID=3063996 RepID=A0ABT9BB68_9BACT|nr:hypothetical protein [Hymenobacter sp. ASUV-10]MDO7875519.1 hypothetical protein [Hymenobacter sp. ASUV-10]
MIRLYTSCPADLGVQGLAIALSHNFNLPVDVLPLSLLPAPDTERRQALRVERAELVEALQRAEWSLEQYRTGQWQPDAGHQNGLEFDRQALLTRREAIDRVLGAEKGGVGRG